MKDFIVKLKMSAECKDDARELIDDYVGQETDVEIFSVREVKGSKR
jgi:hypothetical protein